MKISGVIVPNDSKWIYDWFDVEATCPRDVEKALREGDREVLINSGGGDVYSGSEIYTLLKQHGVDVKIVGIAASAASVIAMAGKTVQISPTAQIMIHNVSTTAGGDYRDLRHEAQVLENYNTSIANAYRLRTRLSQEELLGLMNDETWLTAQQALEYGFVDQIMFDDNLRLTASAVNMLPDAIINKMNQRLNEAKLNLLKLRGAK